jgi:hypothetical protein
MVMPMTNPRETFGILGNLGTQQHQQRLIYLLVHNFYFNAQQMGKFICTPLSGLSTQVLLVVRI